jgi:CRISPR-associated protein Cas1
LALADGQCVVTQETGEIRLPLEDIAWIILDTPQATLTTALLSACMEAGIALIVTDERHHPSGLALPFHRHHRQAEVAALQVALGDGLRNRLWQMIVRAKIRNQAAVLSLCGRSATPLGAMAQRVTPGDAENVEARAARYYWSRLFDHFVRENGTDRRNAMLNYGYAVMRGAVARALVAAGLLPAIGLHHTSALNPFNLADDILEPFRPIIDLMV